MVCQSLLAGRRNWINKLSKNPMNQHPSGKKHKVSITSQPFPAYTSILPFHKKKQGPYAHFSNAFSHHTRTRDPWHSGPLWPSYMMLWWSPSHHVLVLKQNLRWWEPWKWDEDDSLHLLNRQLKRNCMGPWWRQSEASRWNWSHLLKAINILWIPYIGWSEFRFWLTGEQEPLKMVCCTQFRSRVKWVGLRLEMMCGVVWKNMLHFIPMSCSPDMVEPTTRLSSSCSHSQLGYQRSWRF